MNKGTFQFTNPAELQATLTITMTVEQWRKVVASPVGSWNRNQVDHMIKDLILQAEEKFFTLQETSGE